MQNSGWRTGSLGCKRNGRNETHLPGLTRNRTQKPREPEQLKRCAEGRVLTRTCLLVLPHSVYRIGAENTDSIRLARSVSRGGGHA
jgi:hypothetical protein